MRQSKTFDDYTINQQGITSDEREDTFVVYGWDEYPTYSVLAGQSRKCYIESYKTLEAAQAAFPEANISNQWTERVISLNHLPDED